MPKLGLIAGNRIFPIHVARAAKAQGYQVMAVGFKEETSPELEREVDSMEWLSFAQVGRVPELFKQAGVKDLILAGQIRAERLLQGEQRFDGLVQQLLKWMPDRTGSSAMVLAVRYLESQGFRVLDSGVFLKDWIPGPGVLTRRAPTPEEQEDLSFGLPLARELGRLKIGQMVVVRRKAVVAVEGMEGTDAAIRRAGQIAGPGCVVVKACEAGHDMRFDIPVVGLTTIGAMVEAGTTCLGVKGGRTLFMELPKVKEEADQKGLALVCL